MLLFLRRNDVAHTSSGIDVVESRSSMTPSGIHSRSRRHPSSPASRLTAQRIRRRPRPHLPPNHRLDVEPKQIVHPTRPVESPKDVKGRTVHHRRVSIARTGRRARGGGGRSAGTVRTARRSSPGAIGRSGTRGDDSADDADGTAARRSSRSHSSGRGAHRDDLTPGAGGEVKFVKVVDAVLAVVAAEDVEGIAEDGRGVEGALAGRAARGGGVGFDHGPSFLVGHFVVVDVVDVVDVEDEIVIVSMLGKPLLLLLLLLLLIVIIDTDIAAVVVVVVAWRGHGSRTVHRHGMSQRRCILQVVVVVVVDDDVVVVVDDDDDVVLAVDRRES